MSEHESTTGECYSLAPEPSEKPLIGYRVLVPRGGPWGDSVAAALRARGAVPVIAPMINFAPTHDQDALEASLAKLSEGGFDWVTFTSATTVDVLTSYQAYIPATTRVAAVGETTAAALTAAGYHVDFVPTEDNSAQGMLDEWDVATQAKPHLRVLALRSAIAKQVLSTGLAQRGHHVEAVIAYRTVGVPVLPKIVQDVRAGAVTVVLLTSGSVAGQVREQFGQLPATTLVAAIGPQTKLDAELAGVRVDVVAAERTAESLIDAVINAAHARA